MMHLKDLEKQEQTKSQTSSRWEIARIRAEKKMKLKIQKINKTVSFLRR